jgi:flagellar basal-body rod modification protein FlgD
MATSVSATGTTTGLTSALGGDKNLDKTAFLKLLVAQLKNQDPLKPQDNATFVAELAQFSNLEQVIGINDRLDMLSLQSQGMQNTQIAALVGRMATVKGTSVTLNGSGTGTQVAFNLAGSAIETTVTIRDASGRTVRTIDVGARPGGLAKVPWDGRNDGGVPQPAGTYSVAVSAKTSSGASVSVTQNSTGAVQAVSFDKGYPELHLDNGLSVPVAELLRVEASTTNP